jgi:hypothetical protein
VSIAAAAAVIFGFSKSSRNRISEFAINKRDGIKAFLKKDLARFNKSATTVFMHASIRCRNEVCFSFFRTTSFFRIRFFANFIRNITFAMFVITVNGRNSFIRFDFDRRRFAAFNEFGTTFFGGKLSLRNGELARERKNDIGFGDRNADRSNIDFRNRIARFANVFEAFAGFRFFAVFDFGQVFGVAIGCWRIARSGVWSVRCTD